MITVISLSNIASTSIFLTIMRMVGSKPSNASSRYRNSGRQEIPQIANACRFMPFEKVASLRFGGSSNAALIASKFSTENFG
jgi:hypothetical protein